MNQLPIPDQLRNLAARAIVLADRLPVDCAEAGTILQAADMLTRAAGKLETREASPRILDPFLTRVESH